MSFHTLERLFVRLLFDPSLVDRMHEEFDAVFGGLDLEPHERAELLAVDRRAWRCDPLRRLRTLRALADEFKGATTIALASTRSLASLDAFFSSEEFHTAVQERGSMALSFVRYLERLAEEAPIEEAHFAGVLRLEAALARCRRELRAVPLEAASAFDPAELAAQPPGELLLALAPGHDAGAYDANTIEAINAAERYLFEVGLMPAVALCDDAPRLAALPPLAGEETYLLALPSGSGVSLMPIDADYHTLLRALGERPRSLDEAITLLPDLTREDVLEMVASLVEARVVSRR